nr:UDP-N-acetylglucosamine 2-epimerase [uncultured Helicobacter sp.]
MKILAFSSIRSEYDLLSPLYKLLTQDSQIDFRILVSGAHLSHIYGYSIKEIEKDNIPILAKIETLLASDSKISRIKSASLLLQNSLEIIADFAPDVLCYAGDREDVMIYSMISGYLGIPSIHFFGGDHVRDGYIDNPIRHATSKLSSLHFVSCEAHLQRLVAMGEARERIYNIGSIALDKFVDFKPMPLEQIFSYFHREQFTKFAILIFHPVTQEADSVDVIFTNILESLQEANIGAFVSYPNVDYGNQKLIATIERFKTLKNFIFYTNIERDLFLSIYKQAEFIIGNSSSGIGEAASIPIPAINVGMRQTGRMADRNVIFCSSNKQDIKDSIVKATSTTFRESIQNIQNSYGDGRSAKRAYELIKTLDFSRFLSKKEDPLDQTLVLK